MELTTRQVAARLGMSIASLRHHIVCHRSIAPSAVRGERLRWTEAHIQAFERIVFPEGMTTPMLAKLLGMSCTGIIRRIARGARGPSLRRGKKFIWAADDVIAFCEHVFVPKTKTSERIETDKLGPDARHEALLIRRLARGSGESVASVLATIRLTPRDKELLRASAKTIGAKVIAEQHIRFRLDVERAFLQLIREERQRHGLSQSGETGGRNFCGSAARMRANG
jgi:DNA-binding CsgD family transcriptional regulator